MFPEYQVANATHSSFHRRSSGDVTLRSALVVCALAVSGAAAQSQGVADLTTAHDDNPLALLGGSLSFGFAQLRQPGEFTATGPSIGFGVAGKLNMSGGRPVYLEWTGSMVQAQDLISGTEVQGTDPFVYTTNTSPSGVIDLSTLVDAVGAASSAWVQIIDSTGDMATIDSSAFSPIAPDTAVSQFAASFTQSGGIFSALTTTGDTGAAAAYGLIYDDTGFSFLGVGDDSSTTITTSVEEKITAFSSALLLSWRFPVGEEWAMSPKIGPAYRRFDRNRTRVTSVDLAEGFEGATPFPTISMTDSVSLDSTYYGAILGAGLSRKLGDRWGISFGAEGGLASYKARSDTFETIDLAGSTTVANGEARSLDGVSQLGRVTAGLTHVTQGGAVVTLGGFVDYMSDVPYLRYETENAPALTTSGSDVTLNGSGETYRSYTIDRTMMISTGVNLSIVFSF